MRRISLLSTGVVFFLVLSSSFAFAKTYKMIMTNEVAVTHWKTGIMQEVADKIQERSKGQINVKLYSGGQLFTDKAAIKAIGTGAVHMTWPVSVNLEPLRLEYGVVNLPFAINDNLILKNPNFRQELLTLLSGILDKEGIKVIGLLRADELVFVFKGRQPKTVEGMKNLKVRVIGGQVLLDWVGELGITPISMPASEFTTALSQGVIDGIHTSSGGWASMIGELGKYGLLVPDLLIVTYSILLDNKWFMDLPKDLQDVVSSAVNEVSAKQWQYSIEQSDKDYKKITEEFKSVVYRVPDEEVPQWGDKVRPSYSRFAEKFPDVFNRYIELNLKYGRNWPPKK